MRKFWAWYDALEEPYRFFVAMAMMLPLALMPMIMNVSYVGGLLVMLITIFLLLSRLIKA